LFARHQIAINKNYFLLVEYDKQGKASSSNGKKTQANKKLGINFVQRLVGSKIFLKICNIFKDTSIKILL
jgi:hypothetical protein